jgi:hypothetical protein
MHLTHRTVEDGVILSEANNSSSVYFAMTCDDSISVWSVKMHIEVARAMLNETIYLNE